MSHTLWLRTLADRPGARLSLICFPHAGGNAAYFRPWVKLLPDDIALYAVQYPGRMDRLAEPLMDDMDPLADRIAVAAAGRITGPYALFGHSLGASVGYEVAHRMERAGRPPQRLIVSGRPAPHRQRTGAAAERHLASDDALWREMIDLGGTDAELARDPQVQAMAVPVLRNDYRLAERYRRPRPVPLHCPVTALTGTDDVEALIDEVGAWEQVTDGAFDLHTLPGGHFYFMPDPVPLIELVVAALAPAARRPDPAARV